MTIKIIAMKPGNQMPVPENGYPEANQLFTIVIEIGSTEDNFRQKRHGYHILTK